MTKRVQFVDLTLRDGHQSLAATRMTTSQIMRILPLIHDAGFQAFELWGGAVLDSCIRFLNEDPWDRLEAFKDLMGSSKKVRALLRGQNLFAYQPYPDDLVIDFIREAIRCGVGIMRIFDALNDWRNLEIPLIATKAYGGIAEAAICYTTSPVHTVDYFVEFAAQLQHLGADRIAIKDMAGLLHPLVAVDLIKELKKKINLPLTLHSHSTTGVAELNIVIAMMSGVDTVDTAITPFACGTSHPAIEIMIPFAEELGIDHGLDIDKIMAAQRELFKIYKELRDVIPSYKEGRPAVDPKDVDRGVVSGIIELLERGKKGDILEALEKMRALLAEHCYPEYNDKIFEAQVPGGMLSNLYNQLKEMKKLDRYDEILEEIPRVREASGYVPLVTPTSQIVGSQAAFNVIIGEPYKMVSKEFRMLVRGEFGRTPAPVSDKVIEKVLRKGEKPLEYRPAAYLKPVLENACPPEYCKTHREFLLHLLLKQSADEFLKKRHGLSNPQ
jgi:pyruvate/oxaloacetate carboxyltransferase